MTQVKVEEEEDTEMSESAEREAEKSKVDHVNTNARVVEGRYLVEGERQIIELVLDTEREVTHELIDVGSSFSLYP